MEGHTGSTTVGSEEAARTSGAATGSEAVTAAAGVYSFVSSAITGSRVGTSATVAG